MPRSPPPPSALPPLCPRSLCSSPRLQAGPSPDLPLPCALCPAQTRRADSLLVFMTPTLNVSMTSWFLLVSSDVPRACVLLCWVLESPLSHSCSSALGKLPRDHESHPVVPSTHGQARCPPDFPRHPGLVLVMTLDSMAC